MKLKAPVLEFIENLATSEPPSILQLTVSFAVKVNTGVVFSLIDFVLVASPAFPLGPVIIAAGSTVTNIDFCSEPQLNDELSV